MSRTYPEGLSRRLGCNNEGISLSVSAERALDVTAERDNLLLRLNDFKTSKENLESKLLEQDVILRRWQHL